MALTLMNAVVYAAFLALLAVASVADLRTLRIPDSIVAALFAIWLAWRLGVHALGITTAPVTFSQGIVASIMLGGGLLLVTTFYEMITHKRAMGGGDVKLLVVVGLFLGIEGGLFCLLVACVASLLLSVVLPRVGWTPPVSEEEIATSNDVDGDGVPDPAKPIILKSVPFGPAISLGALAAVSVAAFA